MNQLENISDMENIVRWIAWKLFQWRERERESSLNLSRLDLLYRQENLAEKVVDSSQLSLEL